MDMRKTLVLLGAFLLGAAAPDDVPSLSEKTYKQWLTFICPSGEESRWRRLGWRSELWAAVQEAKALQRPILLWAMNGHPLGCT
jgi:hypothetical protein